MRPFIVVLCIVLGGCAGTRAVMPSSAPAAALAKPRAAKIYVWNWGGAAGPYLTAFAKSASGDAEPVVSRPLNASPLWANAQRVLWSGPFATSLYGTYWFERDAPGSSSIRVYPPRMQGVFAAGAVDAEQNVYALEGQVSNGTAGCLLFDAHLEVYQAGRWDRPPQEHQRWVQHKWKHRGDHYEMQEGHWR